MDRDREKRKASRCAYIRACYLAEELRCFGYKTDCILYRKSNGDYLSDEQFHDAMNRLIDKTKARYEKLPG